jgi:hypothetical protein
MKPAKTTRALAPKGFYLVTVRDSLNELHAAEWRYNLVNSVPFISLYQGDALQNVVNKNKARQLVKAIRELPLSFWNDSVCDYEFEKDKVVLRRNTLRVYHINITLENKGLNYFMSKRYGHVYRPKWRQIVY